MKITDPKYILTKKDHGKILRVGKKHFRRIWMKGCWPFWKYGFDGCYYLKEEDDFLYSKDKEWYKEK